VSAKALRKEIEIIERALNTAPKVKPSYYRLDYGTMTDKERFIVEGAKEAHEEIWKRAMKEQNVTRRFNVDWSKAECTEDEAALMDAFNVIFQRHAVSRVEYSRRYPIH